jgi:hypothetical protein
MGFVRIKNPEYVEPKIASTWHKVYYTGPMGLLAMPMMLPPNTYEFLENLGVFAKEEDAGGS